MTDEELSGVTYLVDTVTSPLTGGQSLGVGRVDDLTELIHTVINFFCLFMICQRHVPSKPGQAVWRIN